MTRRLHEPAPPDGWWWVRLSPATPRGADRRWTVFRVLDGAVQPHGSVAWYSPTAAWLRDAEWVPAVPPAACDPPATAIAASVRTTRTRRATIRRDRDEQVGWVAAEIVDVLVGASDAMAAYYQRHPADRDDLVAVVTRLILKAVR